MYLAAFQLPVMIHSYVIRSPGSVLYYPVVHLSNQYVQNNINLMIFHGVQHLQQEQLKFQSGSNPETTGHFEIKTNERGLLSLILTNYTYSHPMAHGMTLATSLTFDTNTGRLYSLNDLFKQGVGLSGKINVNG